MVLQCYSKVTEVFHKGKRTPPEELLDLNVGEPEGIECTACTNVK